MVKKSAPKTKKPAASKTRQVGIKAVAAAKKTNTFAKKNPWVVAGAAAGVGLLLGMLSTKGKKKKK